MEKIPSESGVYFWYVTESGAQKLGLDVQDCTQENNLFLVYVGLAQNLNQRIDWHLNDSHSVSSIKSGFVSTLRQSLSALLVGEMVTSKEAVDHFMRTEMKFRYEICSSPKEREDSLIAAHSLPLNLKGNKGHKFFKILKESRKNSRKKSLNMISGLKTEI